MSHTAGNTIPVLAPSAPRNEPGVETMQTGNAVLSQDERFIQYLRSNNLLDTRWQGLRGRSSSPEIICLSERETAIRK